jgi:predicted phosphodiesterase
VQNLASMQLRMTADWHCGRLLTSNVMYDQADKEAYMRQLFSDIHDSLVCVLGDGFDRSPELTTKRQRNRDANLVGKYTKAAPEHVHYVRGNHDTPEAFDDTYIQGKLGHIAIHGGPVVLEEPGVLLAHGHEWQARHRVTEGLARELLTVDEDGATSQMRAHIRMCIGNILSETATALPSRVNRAKWLGSMEQALRSIAAQEQKQRRLFREVMGHEGLRSSRTLPIAQTRSDAMQIWQVAQAAAQNKCAVGVIGHSHHPGLYQVPVLTPDLQETAVTVMNVGSLVQKDWPMTAGMIDTKTGRTELAYLSRHDRQFHTMLGTSTKKDAQTPDIIPADTRVPTLSTLHLLTPADQTA